MNDNTALFFLVVFCITSATTLLGFLLWYLQTRRSIVVLTLMVLGYLLCAALFAALYLSLQLPEITPFQYPVLTSPLG